MLKRKLNKKGFTLVEVLFALSVLLIGVLGMTFLITTVISSNRFINRMTTALMLSQDKIEDIQREGYDKISSTDIDIMEDYNSIPNYEKFKRITAIDVDHPLNGMKTVTVIVFWDTNSKYVDLHTIIAR